MPVVSIFFGIVIRMYFREPKHFHAEHQALEGKFDFDGNQIVGSIASRNAEASGALIVGDVGQGARDEIDYEPAGAVRRANTCPIPRERPIRVFRSPPTLANSDYRLEVFMEYYEQAGGGSVR